MPRGITNVQPSHCLETWFVTLAKNAILSLENNLADLSTECSSRHQGALVKTGAFSQNVGKLFSELKFVTEQTEKPLNIYQFKVSGNSG